MTLADSLRHLARSAPDPRTDGDLLTAFVKSRDEPAFAELLRRHGPTVFGTCRRVLGNAPDADDAFQAVWLVLARKAGSVRPPGMVGNWLYGVAVRTANKARVMNARKANRRRESPGGLDQHPAAHTAGSPDTDTRAVIDAELAALPDTLRAAFVACDLNGRTRSEAARELGWPEGTVAARVAKARSVLAERLRKRGVTLGVGLFAAAVVPNALGAETMAAVNELLTAGAAASVPAAQQLSSEVVRTMNPFNWKPAAVAAAVLLSAGVGGAVLLAGGPDKQAVREQIKAPVPKVEAMEWVEGKPIELEGGPITSVAASGDGKLLALAQRGKVTLLEADTRKVRFAIAQNLAPTVTAVAFNPKGDKIAFTTTDSVIIRGVDIKDPGESWEMKGFDPHQVAWLSEDSLAATNGVEVKWRLPEREKDAGWQFADGVRGRPTPLVALSDLGMPFVTATSEKKAPSDLARAYPPPASKMSTRLDGHKSRPVAAVVSKDWKRMVSADEGGTLIVWEGERSDMEEKSRVELGEGVQQIALAPDGKTVAAVRAFPSKAILGGGFGARTDVQLHVLDVTDPPAKPKPLWTTGDKPLPGKLDGPVSLVFTPDGKSLYAAFADPFASAGKNDRLKPMGVKVWERKAKTKE